MSAGIHHFRLEFVHETASDVEDVAEAFALALAGRISFQNLGQRLRRLFGSTTEGSLFIPKDFPVFTVLQ